MTVIPPTPDDFDPEDDNAWEIYGEAERVENIRINKLFDRIKELCGTKFHALFLEWIQELNDAGYVHSHEIVAWSPRKKLKQKIDCFYPRKRRISIEYVNQYENGGIEGDSFAGQVWLPLKGNRYFTLYYRM